MALRRLLWTTITMIVVVFEAGSLAHGATINFDALTDLEAVTTQFPGLIFTNTTILTAGISLNEFEFPPRSGGNVVFDDGGAIAVVFNDPQANVGGFLTYLSRVTLTAFDALDNVVGTDASDFASNLALSGDPGSFPNEFLGVIFPGGIRRVTLEGAAEGGSFTLDDLTFTPLSVPEPATLVLLALGVVGWRAVRRFAA